MKHISLIIIALVIVIGYCMAQSPQAFNYQAVLRNPDGTVSGDRTVSVQVGIIAGNANANTIYLEQHLATTNELGLFTLNIGKGQVLEGDFSTIGWGSENHYIKLATDINGGSDFRDLGTFQLLAVPYALYGKDEDDDPKNESIERITLENGKLVIIEAENSMSVDLTSLQDGTEDADSDPTNELQVLAFDPNSNSLSISGGNAIDLPSGGSSLWQESSTGNIFYNGTSIRFNTDPNGNPLSEMIFDPAQSTNTFSLFGTNGNSSAQIRAIRSGGDIRLLGNIDNRARVNLFVDNADNGRMRLGDSDSDDRVNIGISSDKVGFFSTRGGNGNNNTGAGYLRDSPNNGYVWVSGSDDVGDDPPTAGMYVNSLGLGVVFGDIKFFRIDHPAKEDKQIWYASLEGPEAGAYDRGSSKLENGTAFIPYSDHFKIVASDKNVTFSLTPLSADTYGLAVVEQTSEGFRVKELAGGQGDFEFTWEVKAVRKGYENYRVIRDAKEALPATITKNH